MNKKNIYRQKITELVEKIENPKILRCIYIFVSDIMEEIKSDSRKEDGKNEQKSKN